MKVLEDVSLDGVRQSLASNITQIKALPLIDDTSLYLRLTALNAQWQLLPLATEQIKTDKPTTDTVRVSKASSWWREGLAHTWQALRQIVVVRYNASTTLPLALPEDKNLLYQSFRAQTENAIWGLLHRNNVIYQTSLAIIMTWTKQYYVQTDSTTSAAIESIRTLQQVNVQPTTIDLASTLQLINRYFSQKTDHETDRVSGG